MDIKILKGIPIPAKEASPKKVESKYRFHEMEVGDYFQVPSTMRARSVISVCIWEKDTGQKVLSPKNSRWLWLLESEMKFSKRPETSDCLWLSDYTCYEPPVSRRSPGYRRRMAIAIAVTLTGSTAFVGIVMLGMWLVGQIFSK